MFHPDLLGAFYLDLRLHGFNVGVLERQRVDELLLKLQATDAFPQTSDRLCNMLAALLSTNDEQYVHFGQRFEACFGPRHRLKRKPEPPAPVDQPDAPHIEAVQRPVGTNEAARQSEVQRFQIRLITAALVALVLLIFLPNVRFEYYRVESPAVQAERERHTQVQRESRGKKPPAPPIAHWLGSVITSLKAVAPTVEAWVGAGILLATFLPFCALALWVAAPMSRERAYVQRRKIKGRPEMIELMLASPAEGPFECEQVHREIQPLRRPLLVSSQDLDVDATLVATLDNIGVFTPIYIRRPIAPEYLALIERRSEDDHVAVYAKSLIEALKSTHVYVDVFYFEADIRRVYSTGTAPRISLDELCGRYSGHRLILITNGNGLLDPVSGRIEEWALQVIRFSRRICMTPSPTSLWGYRELAIATALELTVLPLLPQSISAAVELLSGDETALRKFAPVETPGERIPIERLADLLEERPGRWSATAPPDPAALDRLEHALRDALHVDGFRWMAACAVYPELNWNLTLHVGMKLRSPEGNTAIDPNRLLLLSIMPWFRDGSMPPWLRTRLANALGTEEYRRVHRIFSNLLLSVFDRLQKNVQLEVAVDRRLPESSRTRETVDAATSDGLLAEFMAGKPRRDRTVFRFPGKVGRYLMAGRTSWVRASGSSALPIHEALANAQAVRATLEATTAASVTVTHAPHPEIGEVPGIRHVETVEALDGEAVQLVDDFFLYQRTGSSTAHLLDQNTVTHLLHRSRLALRISLLNFVFVAVAAFWFADTILKPFPDPLAVAAVCLWIVLPWVLVDLLLVRRFRSCVSEFPTFSPASGLVHKAKLFKLVQP